MTWSIRHEGSPRSVEGLTTAQVIEGLQDGLWEPTDEVRGPDDGDWVAIENHPQFEELAAELEAPPRKFHEDESRLDMNPLIDVCLVLLIFFILTTSYAALQKVLEMPNLTREDAKGVRVISKREAEQLTIRVEARPGTDGPVIKIQDQPVPDNVASLIAELRKFADTTGKTQLLVDAQGVDWETYVRIQDAAKGARIDRIFVVTRPENLPPPPQKK